ncbi:hypothetical protein [Salmonirosea aquatica]|uniref:hypothetical protein n=1 Tax=Salmonirosea aquatica TaxID=2654236 RepID=UPI00357153BC
MKKWIAICLLAGGLVACGHNESSENVRDNETPVTAKDEVDNRQIPPDTLAADTTSIR